MCLYAKETGCIPIQCWAPKKVLPQIDTDYTEQTHKICVHQWKSVAKNSFMSTMQTAQVSLKNRRFGQRIIALQKIKVRAFVGLCNVLLVQRGVAAVVPQRCRFGERPSGFAHIEFFRRH